MRPFAFVTFAALVVAACAGNTDAKDNLTVTGPAPTAPTTTIADAPAAPRSVGVDLDPVTPLEWELIGTWEVVELEDGAGAGVGRTVGEVCDLADDHQLHCRLPDGTASFSGVWLADRAPADDANATAHLAWRSDDNRRGGAARLVIDGDDVTVLSGFDEAHMRRIAELPRAEVRPPDEPGRTQRLLAATWELARIGGGQDRVLGGLRVGSQCTLDIAGPLHCVSGDVETTGTWWLLRGLRVEAGGTGPTLSFTVDEGAGVSSTIQFDGPDRFVFFGSDAEWVRVED